MNTLSNTSSLPARPVTSTVAVVSVGRTGSRRRAEGGGLIDAGEVGGPGYGAVGHRTGEGDGHVTGDTARRVDQLVDGGVAGVAGVVAKLGLRPRSEGSAARKVIEEIVRLVVPQFQEMPTNSSRSFPSPWCARR